MVNCTFLGLGVMGYPMAGHLQAKGHSVTVFNRTTAKAEKWANEHGGSFAKTPAEAVVEADIVFCCVGNDDDLRSVCLGDTGAFGAMKAGSIFVDHTTASATVARELAAIATKGNISFIDAPVSGGQAGAENGVLTVMCGGDAAAFAKAEPVIMCFSQAARLLGDVGAGQLTKMVNQICIAGLVQGLSEGVSFAQRAGLNVKDVLNTIDKGAAGSWQMSNRGQTMAEDQFEFGFAVDWMLKDLGIVLEEAAENGADLPVTKTVRGFYEEVSEMGGGRWDTSSLLRRFTK